MNDFAKKADRCFVASMIGYGIQIVLVMVSTLWLVPTHKSPNPVVCVVFLLPLLILLPWLIKRNIRAHIWLCFMMMGYFMAAVIDAFMPTEYGYVLPLVKISNSVFVFIVAMLFARYEQKRYQISVTR